MTDITNYTILLSYINNNPNTILVYDNSIDKTQNSLSNIIENNIIKLSYDYTIDQLLILMTNLNVKSNIKYLYDKYRSIGFNKDIIHKILKYIDYNLHKENIIYEDIKEYIEDKSIYGSYKSWSSKYQTLNEHICFYYDFSNELIIHRLINNLEKKYIDKVIFFDKDEYINDIIIDRFHIYYYYEKINDITYIFKYFYNNDQYLDKYKECLQILYDSRTKSDLLYGVVINEYYKKDDLNMIINYYKYNKLLSITKLINDYNKLDDKWYDFIFSNDIINIKDMIDTRVFSGLIKKNNNLIQYLFDYIFKNNLIQMIDNYNDIDIDLLNEVLTKYLKNYTDINEIIVNNILRISDLLSYELCIEIMKKILLFREHLLLEQNIYNNLNDKIIEKLENYNEILEEDNRIIINYLNRFDKNRIHNEIYDEYKKELKLINKLTKNKLDMNVIKIIHEFLK
jgi:hypothetical protein